MDVEGAAYGVKLSASNEIKVVKRVEKANLSVSEEVSLGEAVAKEQPQFVKGEFPSKDRSKPMQ